MIRFFSSEEEERIIRAIREAERNTSGEIRVHLEHKCQGDTMQAAHRTFRQLRMNRTKLENGVLLFLVPERKEFTILGDKGINNIVPEHFWEDVRDLMQQHFRMGAFCDGVTAAIALVGEKLKVFFPAEKEEDNELPDDISYS